MEFIRKSKPQLLIIFMAFACWSGLLALRGIWWDDWAWIWHYFGTDNFKDYILPFRNLHKHLEGVENLLFYKMFNLWGYASLNAWNIAKFAVYIVNSVLFYLNFKAFFKLTGLEDEKFPLFAALSYLVSPVMNNLTFTVLPYHIELMSFMLSIYFSLKTVEDGGFKKGYYFLSLAFSYYSVLCLGSYIFFEIIRPVMLYYVFLSRPGAVPLKSAKHAVLFWVPFLLIGAAVLAFFALRPQVGIYAGVYKMQSLSLPYFKTILQRYFNTYFYMVYVYLACVNNIFKGLITSYPVPLLLAAALSIYAALSGRAGYDKMKSSRLSKIAAFGIFVLLLGYLPYALVREEAIFGMESRHALLANVGLNIIIAAAAAALYYLNKAARILSCILFTAVILLGVLECRVVVDAYAKDWRQQQQFWKAFTSAIPDVKENTFFIVDMPREQSRYFGPWRGGYELSGPLNMLYAKSDKAGEMHKLYAEEMLTSDYESIKDENEIVDESYTGKRVTYYPRNLVYVSFYGGKLEINKPNLQTFKRPPYYSEMLRRTSRDRIINRSVSAGTFKYRWIMGGAQ
jgi:hypothetical protein